MAGVEWSQEELDTLLNNYKAKSCKEIAEMIGRTTKSVQHKFNQLGLERPQAKVGDVINGWKITEIYTKVINGTNKSIAKVISTLDNKTTHEYRLTLLTKGKVGWPDRRRPDIKERDNYHGLCRHKLYSVWIGMKNRCYNEKQRNYHNYGGRGIKMCDEWRDDFLFFYNWAIENGWQEGLQLDREENDKDYSPDNCRFITRKENIDNRRVSLNLTAWGETKNASDWALDGRCKVTYGTLTYRIQAGWTPEAAISSPTNRTDEQTFRRYKELYKFMQENHPELIEEFQGQ